MQERLVLVDGSYYLHRAYHAMTGLSSPDGHPTSVVYGVVNMLRNLHQHSKPDLFGIVFDAPGKTFRHEMFPPYKSNRPPMPEDLACQIDILFAFLKAFGYPILQVTNVEADDVLGTLSMRAVDAGCTVLIATGDKDLAQLVRPEIELLDSMRDVRMDNSFVKKKFGVHPHQIPEYLALCGDASDNIPGIPGVGPKTAAKWINQFGGIAKLVENAPKIKGKVGENLRSSISVLPLYRRLTTIHTDVETGCSVHKLRNRPPNLVVLADLCKTYNFRSLMRELHLSQKTEEYTSKNIIRHGLILDEKLLKEWLEVAIKARFLAFFIVPNPKVSSRVPSVETQETSHKAPLPIVGIAIATKNRKAAYIPISHDYPGVPRQLSSPHVIAAFVRVLEDPSILKVTHDSKTIYKCFWRAGYPIKAKMEDCMLQSYALDPQRRVHTLTALMNQYCPQTQLNDTWALPKDASNTNIQPFARALVDAASIYAQCAIDCCNLYFTLQNKLQEQNTTNESGPDHVYLKIEAPLAYVLARIEQKGVYIHSNMLREQSRHLGENIHRITEEIYQRAGKLFNIDSPLQIQEILFEDCKLPVLKKTPKGKPSTDEKSLQQLAKYDPLPAMILEHRLWRKLKTTYTDKLPRMVNPQTGRVHTTYHQALTVTGRLSSSDPNLQNIPVRSDEGKKIREAFVAPEGYCLISADYSQIEMRIMAHLSQDQRLIDVFQNDGDIHLGTASEVFALPLNEITQKQRRIAKATNFGLIYGISPFGLAKQLDIPYPQAKSYLENFFSRYPAVARYMQHAKDFAKEHGYAQTMFGRRTPLPEIQKKKYTLRSAAQRNAINCPIQGSAADIIKISMRQLHVWLEENDCDASIILQVHDELVIEASLFCAEEVKQRCCEIMRNVTKLKVPLKVCAGIGKNWQESHA